MSDDDEEEKNESRFLHFIEVLMFRHSRLKSSSSSSQIEFLSALNFVPTRNRFWLLKSNDDIPFSELIWISFIAGWKGLFVIMRSHFPRNWTLTAHSPLELRTIARYFVNFYYILIQLLIMIAQKANGKWSRAIPITTTIAPAEMLVFLFFERPVGTDLHHATQQVSTACLMRQRNECDLSSDTHFIVTMRRKRKCHESICWLLICRWRHYLDNHFSISVTAIARRCWKCDV